jgi:hypothetical protein
MAIDGTKIIDSDLGHDVYSEFMDLYDADFEVATIRKSIDKYRNYGLDEVEYEIFMTVYCLALWEIGHLDADMFKELNDLINEGKSIEFWSEDDEYLGQKVGKQREQELKKLVKKLSQPKTNPRKRKKYRRVTRLVFSENDVVVFQAKDRKYRAAIIAEISQHRGQCSYHFAPLDFIDLKIPDIEKLTGSNIVVSRIGCGYDDAEIIRMQPGVDKLWTSENYHFIIGLVYHGIEHKDLLRFKDKFTKIGQIEIKAHFKSLGSIGYASEYDTFVERGFSDIDNYIKIFGGSKIPLEIIVE